MSNAEHDQKIENLIKEEGADVAPRVSKDRIDNLMSQVKYVVTERPNGTTSTFVHAYLRGKFYLGSGFSGAVSEANFNAKVGAEVALKKAEEAARNKLWELEGYRLFIASQIKEEQEATDRG